MKIGDTSIEAAALATGVIAKPAAPRRARRATPDGADCVQIVEVARACSRLLGRLGDATPDPARAAQVAILRNAVASGRYRPDLESVARKLLVELAAEPRR